MSQIKQYQISYGDYQLKFLNIGAVITEYSYKGHNIVLSFANFEGYKCNSTNMGSVVGRTAGRIRDGKIAGWQLPLNQDGKHNLHGNQLQYQFYNVETTESKAVLTLNDPEGDFPGNVEIKITFELTSQGLLQTIEAESDKPTVLNMTNHSYFNLGGDSILDHRLQIEADTILTLDHDLLPVGTMYVKDTVFDFNQPRKIRDSYKLGHEQFAYSKFIDHPYKLNGKIELESDNLKLAIETDQDYLVVYTGNYIGDEQNVLNDGMNHDYSAICLETQAAPGSTDLVTSYRAQTYYKLSGK